MKDKSIYCIVLYFTFIVAFNCACSKKSDEITPVTNSMVYTENESGDIYAVKQQLYF